MMYLLVPPGGFRVLNPRAPRPSRNDIGALLADDTDTEGTWALVTLHVLVIGGEPMQLLHDTRKVGLVNNLVSCMLATLAADELPVHGKAIVLTGNHMLTGDELASFNVDDGSGQWGHA